MKAVIRFINKRTKYFGIDLFRFFNAIRGIPFYFRTYRILKKQKKKDSSFTLKRSFPILYERFEKGGVANGHYFHQDLYVAKKIYNNKPIKHVDIGSRVDGFVAHVAVFREIEIFDIREVENKVPNIYFKRQDMMEIQDNMFDYCDSLSALHSIEHFGLGRYGDPVNYDGHIVAINNIAKILKKGGTFYFSVPIGKQKIEFNAQRVFSISYLIDILTKKFELCSFSYVDDKGDFHPEVELTAQNTESSFGCEFGCGIFELTKK